MEGLTFQQRKYVGQIENAISCLNKLEFGSEEYKGLCLRTSESLDYTYYLASKTGNKKFIVDHTRLMAKWFTDDIRNENLSRRIA